MKDVFLLSALVISSFSSLARAESEACFCRSSIDRLSIEPKLDCLELNTLSPTVCRGQTLDVSMTNTCKTPVTIKVKEVSATKPRDIAISASETQRWTETLEPAIGAQASDKRNLQWSVISGGTAHTLKLDLAVKCAKKRGSASHSSGGCQQGPPSSAPSSAVFIWFVAYWLIARRRLKSPS